MNQDIKEPTITATFRLIGPEEFPDPYPEYAADMRVWNKTFTDETVHAEGMAFYGCTFVRCAIYVDGNTLFLGTWIDYCNLIPVSEAERPILASSFIYIAKPISEKTIDFRLVGTSYLDKEMPQSEYEELVKSMKAEA